ncbi:glycosyltransferase family 4 protein [Sulfuracidifex tepidarius]|uniref:glycosyltransferase family 4 protein n=1 Tax=Sulfuracidifex tepidarius TaxID=1294262 RepID=UPI000B07DCBF|nr:glycosyltransferase family 4 protein [Sulfuracidifex tepidarius]
MRIIQVAPFYHPVLGGVEKVVQKISEYMKEKGHEVVVVTYNRDRDKSNIYKEKEIINGVEVIRLPPKFTWSHGSYSSLLPKIVSDLNPDLIHVHVWRHPHVFQLSSMKVPKILQPHSPFYSRKQIGKFTFIYYKIVDSFLGKEMKNYNVISITPLERDTIKKKFKVDSVVIPNGIEDYYFDVKSKGDDYYLFLGRVSSEKNVMKMLKGFALSKVSRPLIIAGPDGGLGTEVRSFIHKTGINAKYVGSVTEEEKIELLSKCRALINPRPYEAFGITLIEAQAMGKPCMIVGHGGQEYAAPPGVSSIRGEDNEVDISNLFKQIENDEILNYCQKELDSIQRGLGTAKF